MGTLLNENLVTTRSSGTFSFDTSTLHDEYPFHGLVKAILRKIVFFTTFYNGDSVESDLLRYLLNCLNVCICKFFKNSLNGVEFNIWPLAQLQIKISKT